MLQKASEVILLSGATTPRLPRPSPTEGSTIIILTIQKYSGLFAAIRFATSHILTVTDLSWSLCPSFGPFDLCSLYFHLAPAVPPVAPPRD